MRVHLRLRPAVAVLVVLAALTGCARRLGSDPALAGRLPVVLVAEGSTLHSAAARQAVVDALEAHLGRRVVLLDDEPSDGDVEAVASELRRTHAELKGYDGREPACRAERLVLPVLQHTAEAAYRVRLDTPGEAPDSAGAMAGLLAAVGVHRPVVMKAQALGTIELRTFTEREGIRYARLRAAPGELLGDVIARGLGALPDPPGAQWAAEGRRLVAAGCPVLALAVYDARLALRDDGAGVRQAALRAIAPPPRPAPTRKVASAAMDEFRIALRDDDLARAAEVLARYENDPHRRATTLAHMRSTLASRRGPVPGPDGTTCTTLCEMHMVEMCNNDRELWHENQRSWEYTPCGKKRADEFLQACYLHQWLSGTFQGACVSPCDEGPGGRAKLRHILQQSGCRVDPS
jgi:hypothetical protein